MCSLEFINTEWVLKSIVSFRETDPISGKVSSTGEVISKFADAGYDSSNFIELLGPILYMVILFLVVVFFKLLLRRMCKNCGDNFCTRRVRAPINFWIITTRFLLEGCLEIGLSVMISILMAEEETFENFGEIFSFLMAVVTLFGLIFALIQVWRLSKMHLNDLEQGEESPYAELFEGHRPDRAALLYQFVFLSRRYLMICVLTIMPWSKYVQMLSQIWATIFVICYLIMNRPFVDRFLNWQETINEFTVLIAAYPLYVFTNWVWDEERR